MNCSIAGENSQLDDLYTRYRQRLRKSLFESGLTTAFVACIICLCVLFSYQVKIDFSIVFHFHFYNTLIVFRFLVFALRTNNKSESLQFDVNSCLQLVFDILLTLLTIIIICSVLIALQFPIVMSSPLTALGFAVLITVSLGSVSAKVGTTLAPLPIFALILVSIDYCYTRYDDEFQSTTTQNGKCQTFYFVFLLFTLKIKNQINQTGSTHNATSIVACICGFGCYSIDNPFWFSNRIEQ